MEYLQDFDLQDKINKEIRAQSGTPAAPSAKEHGPSGFLHKFEDAIVGGSEGTHQSGPPSNPPSAPPSPSAPKHEGLLEKLGFSTPEPAAPVLPSPPAGPTHEHLFDKLTAHISGGDKKPLPEALQESQPEPKREHFIDKLTERWTGEHGSNVQSVPTPPVAPEHQGLLHNIQNQFAHQELQARPPEPEHHSLMHKISSQFVHQEPQAPPPPPPQPEHRDILHMIGSAFGEHKEKQAPDPDEHHRLHRPTEEAKIEAHKHDGFLDKLGARLSSSPPGHPVQKEESIVDQINSIVHPSKIPTSEDHGLLNELNSRLGGGAKGEQDEDKLDKTIDFVQEHFLHQGDQHNETALEQFRDKQLAAAIRSQYKGVTGHEFPIKEKKHEK